MKECEAGLCQAGIAAVNYFGKDYHCAEAVVLSALEHLGHDAQAIVPCATPLGGGVGRSFQECCGALSGAILVLGYLYGRKEPGQSWDYVAELTAAFRDDFIESYGTTKCICLREKFGPEAQQSECRKIVGRVADDLVGLIKAEGECCKITPLLEPSSTCCR